ncbi:MAG: XkdX family protein [Candidatus Cryptobacteroides sp.]
MRTLVESLKRLYKKGTLTQEQIAERVEKGSISAEEYEYITGEKYPDGETE